MSEPLLVVENLTKHFPAGRGFLRRSASSISALERVSFSVERGESFGIVGESGSGKSTLAQLLVRLQTPTAGRIVFDGLDLAALDRRQSLDLRRRIQIVFQDPHSSLDPRMRLDQIIGEGLYHARLGRRERRARIAELVELVGLGQSVLRNYPHQLSGGQRQRVGIARALAADPLLLIADEPVSALDASVQGQILNLLRRLQRERSLTLIFVTHELSVARYMSDRVAVMHLGQVVELAEADALFTRPLHPYTQALVSAMPTYGQGGGDRVVLHGELPSPIDPPRNCRFSSRCFRRIERCVQEEPQLVPAGDDARLLACFNPDPNVTEGARWARSHSTS